MTIKCENEIRKIRGIDNIKSMFRKQKSRSFNIIARHKKITT